MNQRASLLRQLADEYERLECMLAFVERIDLGAVDPDVTINWRLGAAIEGYKDLCDGMKPILVQNLVRFANFAIEQQRAVVRELAQSVGITEWQP